MLRRVPRSLANVAQQHNRQSQLRWHGGGCSAALCTISDISQCRSGRGVTQLERAQLISIILPLPGALAARAMSSSAARKERPWSGELVVPEMDGEEQLPSNFKIDAQVLELIEQQDDENPDEEEEGDEATDEADEQGEQEDDEEAAALESTLPPLEEEQARQSGVQSAPTLAQGGTPADPHVDAHGYSTGTDVDVYSWTEGNTVDTRTLDPAVFGVSIRRDVVHDVIRWQLAKRRKGNAKTKRIGEIRGSGRKVRPQKGQGMARAGHSRPPHWRGGAKAHGPRIRDWSYKLNKKFVKLGLRCALSARLREGRLKVVDNLNSDTFSTFNMLRTMEERGIPHSVVFLDKEWPQQTFVKSTTNIIGTKILPARGANVYDIIKRENVVLTVDAVAHLEQVLKP